MQVGALCPTGFNNPGLDAYGTVALWKPGIGVTYKEINGPRFVTVRDVEDYEKALKRAARHGYKLFVRWVCRADELDEARRTMDNHMEYEVLEGGEVVPDKGEAEAHARTAANVARSADTLDEALAAYVRKLQLPEGVSPDEVLVRARKYLATA